VPVKLSLTRRHRRHLLGLHDAGVQRHRHQAVTLFIAASGDDADVMPLMRLGAYDALNE
jgi:hypothetical protein